MSDELEKSPVGIGWVVHRLSCYRGARVRRRGWNGKGMWIQLMHPTEQSDMTLPYIYMKTACGNLVPWLASQTDILADDWEKADD
jgi:hypothetical protein